MRASAGNPPPSLEADPSTRIPTGYPLRGSAAAGRSGAEPHVRCGAVRHAGPSVGQTADPSSPTCTAWAHQTSSPEPADLLGEFDGSTPNRSRQYLSSSTVSARWVWSRTPALSPARPRPVINSGLTVNGEHGASATWSMAPGAGSWKRSMTRSLSEMDALVLDHVVGRKPAAALADAHRSAGQVDPDPSALGAIHLVVQPSAPGRG